MVNKKVFYEQIEKFYFSKKPFLIVLFGTIIFFIIQGVLYKLGYWKIGFITIDSPNAYLGWVSLLLSFFGTLLFFYGSFYVGRKSTFSSLLLIVASIILLINAIVVKAFISFFSYLFTVFIVSWRNFFWKTNKHHEWRESDTYLISLLITFILLLITIIFIYFTINLDFMNHYQENIIFLILDTTNLFFVVFASILVNFKKRQAFLFFTLTKIFAIPVSIFFGQLIITFQLFIWFLIDFSTYLLWNYQKNN